MRILFVCTDAEVGGAERFLASLASAKRSEDVVGLVVLMTQGSMSEQFSESFDHVVYLGYPPTSRNLPGMVRGLKKAVTEFRPDVVTSHLFHADLVTALASIDVPVTTTVHTQAFGEGVHPLTKMIAKVVGKLSKRFAAVIPASTGAQMETFLHELGYKNIVEGIPNGAEMPETPSFDATQRRFVSLARNHPVKGHLILFQSFKEIAHKVPEWSLDAYGPGVDSRDSSMQETVVAAGLTDLIDSGRVRLCGPTQKPEDALATASALIISSLYGEAFPIVGAEAAGAGVPVITTDLGSCAEFADDPSYLVEPGNVDSLASAMLKFAQLSDAERLQLSNVARARAEARYHPSAAYEQYRKLFTLLIAPNE